MIKDDFVQTAYGYCFYNFEGKNAFIYGLYVYPKHRRQGKARRLLVLVIDEIKATGYDGEIEIEVDPKENSITKEDLENFYRSMGLRVYSRPKMRTKRSNAV